MEYYNDLDLDIWVSDFDLFLLLTFTATWTIILSTVVSIATAFMITPHYSDSSQLQLLLFQHFITLTLHNSWHLITLTPESYSGAHKALEKWFRSTGGTTFSDGIFPVALDLNFKNLALQFVLSGGELRYSAFFDTCLEITFFFWKNY